MSKKVTVNTMSPEELAAWRSTPLNGAALCGSCYDTRWQWAVAGKRL